MNTANCVPSKLFLRVGNIAFYYHYKKLYLALWWISVIILFSIARMQQCSMRKSMFKAKVYKKKFAKATRDIPVLYLHNCLLQGHWIDKE